VRASCAASQRTRLALGVGRVKTSPPLAYRDCQSGAGGGDGEGGVSQMARLRTDPAGIRALCVRGR
jgi:hypothetical protein